jgi:hypothetical protein
VFNARNQTGVVVGGSPGRTILARSFATYGPIAKSINRNSYGEIEPDPEPRIPSQRIIEKIWIVPAIYPIPAHFLEIPFLIDLGDPVPEPLDVIAFDLRVGLVDPVLAPDH